MCKHFENAIDPVPLADLYPSQYMARWFRLNRTAYLKRGIWETFELPPERNHGVNFDRSDNMQDLSPGTDAASRAALASSEKFREELLKVQQIGDLLIPTEMHLPQSISREIKERSAAICKGWGVDELRLLQEFCHGAGTLP